MNRVRPDIPTATYRVQFNKDFTFRQACKIVPYLDALGITHVFASPFFQATPDSAHGYDISDHNNFNPQIGSREDFDAFVAALHAHGMGLIADFVPNHMGIGTPLNAWWMDVLENGPSSVFAPHFDIDWQPVKPELKNKVLLPILADQYGRILERGEFKLAFDGGAFFVRYFEARLPLTPGTFTVVLRPALAKMAARGAADDHRLEMESILTALDHLPSETDPEKIAERAREKEIIKRRIARLCDECACARESIDAAMREIEGAVGEARSFDALDELLNAQTYRLSFWRVAAEEINYRRFFDINELAAIRVELPEVFETAHRLIFELIDNGSVDGLRIDHVDGLWNPREYLEKIRHRFATKAPPLYLVVEKILIGEESLRGDWPVDGTTGYDFTNQVTGLLVDSTAEKSLTETYQKFIADAARIDEIVYQKKQLVMRLSLASEINLLSHMLSKLAEKNRWYRDFTLNALTAAVREVTACFPVYRTYLADGEETGDADRQAILRAVSRAKRRNPGIEQSVFNFLCEILLLKFPENIDDAARQEHLRFVMKFQQCTSPVMAKGLEDAAFYIFNRLVALNEVGGEPQRFGLAPEKFHSRCAARLRAHPHAMLTTSTHDTKRSEDVRARIAAISEMPSKWRQALRRWRTVNRRFKRDIEGEQAPDANEEYLFYQTLLGTWPLSTLSRKAHGIYVRRLQEYMIKAIKEAKVNSSWIQPHDDWEEGVRVFAAKVLRRGPNRFLKDFEPVAREIAQLGAINSLAQSVLKCTVPGMPDFYQGCEMWNFTLVDPDNRQPVDYELLRHALDSVAKTSPRELLECWPDGRLKLFVTQRLLRFRREHAPLFQRGDFAPLRVSGAFAECCVAFSRRFENELLIVVAPRLTQRIGFPPIGESWQDTMIEAPLNPQNKPWRELLTSRELFAGPTVTVANILNDLPVAVFAAL